MTSGARVDLDDGWRVGEDKQLVFTITDDQGRAVNPAGWLCRWRLWAPRAPHGTAPLLTVDAIGTTAGVAVNVPATATAALLPGTYEHSLWRIDPGLTACLASATVELGGVPVIVTKDQLRDYMSGVGLTSYQSQAADDVLAGTQARLERHLRRSLELRTHTEPLQQTLGWHDPEHDPVVSVSTDGYLPAYGGSRIAVTTTSLLTTLGAAPTVTYVAGFDGTQPEFADVRLAILRVAAREMDARHGKARTVRDTTTTREPQPDTQRRGIGWTAEELEEFSHLRRRVLSG